MEIRERSEVRDAVVNVIQYMDTKVFCLFSVDTEEDMYGDETDVSENEDTDDEIER